METKKIELGDVQKTLFLPLWGRAVETKKQRPLLVDSTAVRIVDSIPYDFSTISRNMHPLTRASWIARSLYFDNEIRNYLDEYPGGTVINVGCGLDTTFERIDNGKVVWYDLDLPDVIELRKAYIGETERRRFIGESVFGNTWHEKIENRTKVLIVMGGVIYYFSEDDVKKLLSELVNHFRSVELIFDYSSKKGVEIANRKVIEAGGMKKDAHLIWGTDNIKELERWGLQMRIINAMGMFKTYRKNYPITKRLGMILSDALKIMSLCHIRLGGENDGSSILNSCRSYGSKTIVKGSRD